MTCRHLYSIETFDIETRAFSGGVTMVFPLNERHFVVLECGKVNAGNKRSSLQLNCADYSLKSFVELHLGLTKCFERTLKKIGQRNTQLYDIQHDATQHKDNQINNKYNTQPNNILHTGRALLC